MPKKAKKSSRASKQQDIDVQQEEARLQAQLQRLRSVGENTCPVVQKSKLVTGRAPPKKKKKINRRALEETSDNVRSDVEQQATIRLQQHKQSSRNKTLTTNMVGSRSAAKWQEELAKANKKNEELQEKLAAQNNEISAASRNAIRLTKCSEILDKIEAITKYWLSRTHKFIETDEIGMDVTEKVLAKIPRYHALDRPTQNAWVVTYKQSVYTALNAWRNYVQSQMKDVCDNWMNAIGKSELPGSDKILACALRNIDVEDDEQYALFKIYWEKFLPKTTKAALWGSSERHYKIVSEAKLGLPEAPNVKMFPPSTEAFVVTVYENCFKKWMDIHQWKKDNPGCKLPKPSKENKEQTKWLKTKYTDQDSGQVPLGGWNVTGKRRFAHICKQVKAARTKDDGQEEGEDNNYVKVERQFLAKLRNELGIDALDAEEERKRRRKRKRKGNQEPEPAPQIVAYIDSEDEE